MLCSGTEVPFPEETVISLDHPSRVCDNEGLSTSFKLFDRMVDSATSASIIDELLGFDFEGSLCGSIPSEIARNTPEAGSFTIKRSYAT